MYLVLGSGIEKVNANSIFDSFGYFRIDDTRCVVAKSLGLCEVYFTSLGWLFNVHEKRTFLDCWTLQC